MTLAQKPLPVIRSAEEADDRNLTMVLVAAFFFGDFAPYLIPDAAERASHYFPYFEILANHALRTGQVDLIIEDEAAMPAAAAIWYRVGPGSPVVDPPGYDARLLAAVGPYLARFVSLDRAMHEHHPTGCDHDYLGHLAVQPALQGRGLGSRLLAYHHRQLDAAGLPAYLEATGERNRHLYQRHGYAPLDPYGVGEAGPLLHPMWRPAQRA